MTWLKNQLMKLGVKILFLITAVFLLIFVAGCCVVAVYEYLTKKRKVSGT